MRTKEADSNFDLIFILVSALLLLFDVTNRQSYNNVKAWLGEIREYAQEDVVIMLLGKSRAFSEETKGFVKDLCSKLMDKSSDERSGSFLL